MAVIRPHLNMGARMPPVSDKMLGIEASRGIAASAVVLYHSARHLDHIYGVPILMASLQFGHAGVDLFFVISGFIILYVHYFDIDQPSRISHYASRRFTRLMPTYWVALALTAAMSILAHGSLPSIAQSFWSVTLLPSAQPLILGIAWTLRHEVTFYLIFCILLLNRTIGLFAFAIWFVLSLLGTVGYLDEGSWLPPTLHSSYNIEFFLGMAAAYLARNRTFASPGRIIAAGVIMFAAAALAEDVGWMDGYANSARIFYGVPAAVIVLGLATLRGVVVSIPSLLRTLGKSSYSIYLAQYLFIGIVWKTWLALGLDHHLPHTASFPLLAFSAIAGGIAFSRWIEYPLIGLTRTRRLTVAVARAQ